MFAIIKTGGKQYKVSKGTEIWVEKLPQEAGSEVEFNDVLLVADDSNVQTGKDVKASVKGKVIVQGRRKKLLVFKQIRRKRYRKTKGHRQDYTAVEITDISIN